MLAGMRCSPKIDCRRSVSGANHGAEQLVSLRGSLEYLSGLGNQVLNDLTDLAPELAGSQLLQLRVLVLLATPPL